MGPSCPPVDDVPDRQFLSPATLSVSLSVDCLTAWGWTAPKTYSGIFLLEYLTRPEAQSLWEAQHGLYHSVSADRRRQRSREESPGILLGSIDLVCVRVCVCSPSV